MPGHFIGQCVLPVESIFLFFADKAAAAGLAEGAAQVRRVRASVEVIRGFLLLA